MVWWLFIKPIIRLIQYKHERELEALKNKYANELETTKAELEKTKLLFARYSEKQFELYNDLWKVLLYTKQQADMLWEKQNLHKFQPSVSR